MKSDQNTLIHKLIQPSLSTTVVVNWYGNWPFHAVM